MRLRGISLRPETSNPKSINPSTISLKRIEVLPLLSAFISEETAKSSVTTESRYVENEVTMK